MYMSIYIKPINEKIIGKRLTLPDWNEEAYFLVCDIGYKYIIGTIFERRQAIVNEVRPIDQPWEEYKGPRTNRDEEG